VVNHQAFSAAELLPSRETDLGSERGELSACAAIGKPAAICRFRLRTLTHRVIVRLPRFAGWQPGALADPVVRLVHAF
jgi:hypothetical protein